MNLDIDIDPGTEKGSAAVLARDGAAIDGALDAALGAGGGEGGDKGGAPAAGATKPVAKVEGGAGGEGAAGAGKAGEGGAAAAAKPGEGGAAGAGAAAAKKDEGDPDVDKIEEPVGLSPQNRENFGKLRTVAKEARAQVKELTTKLEAEQKARQEIEAKVGGLPPKEEIEELRAFRRTFDAARDPELRKQFDDQVTAINGELESLLKRGGLKEESLKAMKEKGFDTYDAAWWKKNIIDPLAASEDAQDQQLAVLVKDRVDAKVKVEYGRQQAIDAARDGQSAYWKKIEERQKAEAQKEEQYVNGQIAEMRKTIPWLGRQEIPANATAEQKAAIEAQNKKYEQVEGRFRQAYGGRDVETRFQTAVAACLAFELSEENEALRTRNTQLEEQVKKMKGAGKFTPGGGAPNAGKAGKAVSSLGRLKMRDEDAVDAGLDEVMGGGN